MTFHDILDGTEVLAQSGDAQITDVEYDSRQVRPGSLFLAMRGGSVDGNRFIDAAIAAGAVAVVTDSPQEPPRKDIAWALVPHGRRALGRISANFYGRPAERLALTGITGTNGKSTTAFLLESILNSTRKKCALVGTIEYHVCGQVLAAPHTTPESLELNRLFAQAVACGSTEAVLEVSSHALDQQRVFGIPFDVAIFTNLTRDHLDYHATFDDYFAAKRVLFEGCGAEPPRVAILNRDDAYGAKLVPFSKGKHSEVLTYGIGAGDFHAEELQISQSGTRFRMVTPEGSVPIFSPLLGKVNVSNILAAAGAGYARDCNLEQISMGVSALARVPGRFERVDADQPFSVVVDYAHTDDALRNLTALAREFVAQHSGKGRVITVFGCGGDRDRAKRPLMAAAAAQGSDFVVLTSDNPRSERPLAIIRDALPSLQRLNTRFAVEPDRRAAIALALHEARPGDIVLIAGKGHEKVQILPTGPVPFDDVQVARDALRVLGYGVKKGPAVTSGATYRQ
jgi:UDP-N-acetylmuramoyl-L-alanyl-D-glutamate--2,6-diaminopimelate ligase